MNNLKGKTVKESMLIGSMLIINFTDETGIRVLPQTNNDLSSGLNVADLPLKPEIDTSQFIGLSK
jgi:hypothetical protein